MRRVLAVLVGAGIAVGGGSAAWAGTAGADGPKREAARACLGAARQEDAGADKAALKEAVTECLKGAGFEGRSPTPEQRAKREALRDCVKAAKDGSADDKAAARTAARSCLAQAGVTPGRLRAKLSGAKECLAKVRDEHRGAPKAELRAKVKECVAAK